MLIMELNHPVDLVDLDKKDDFAEYCPNLGADEFDGFKKLFDLILEIKGL